MRNATRTCAAGLASLGAAAATSLVAEPTEKPNIIVVFTDDHGYADLNCQGQLNDLKTPHLDQLAADGVRCTSGYITAPQCIPSRAGILSGRYQTRFGVDHNGCIPIPLDEVLIPQRLQRAGYTTGMVGKWHLDPNHAQRPWIRENLPDKRDERRPRIPARLTEPYQPDKRGFTDAFCGHINSYRATYDLDGRSFDKARMVKKDGYRLDIQTDAALAFIDRHPKDPFFLYLAYFAPHVPLDATDKYLSRFPKNMPRRRRIALAMLAAIDDGVGRLRERLDEHGLTDNTLIFFISDNGAPLKITMEDKPGNGPGWDGSRNDPWIGEKGTLMEGGIRVPFMATWPGTLPAGTTYDSPVISLDVGVTAVALAGLPPVKELDGENIIPHLSGRVSTPPHDALFWRFWNQTAIRKGRWKYLQAGGDLKYLFDMESPQHEGENLILRHPEIAEELQQTLKVWAQEQKITGIPSGQLNSQEVKFYSHYMQGVQ